MRNISFMLTLPQMEERIKDVTRRDGWWNLTPGTSLMAVKKGMGLKRGEKIERLYPILVLDVRRDKLSLLTENIEYGYAEVLREGFPNMHPWEFVQFFCDTHKCQPTKLVNRIEFREITKGENNA